jgi:hypothetical protein
VLLLPLTIVFLLFAVMPVYWTCSDAGLLAEKIIDFKKFRIPYTFTGITLPYTEEILVNAPDSVAQLVRVATPESNVIEERDKCLFDKIRKNSEHNLYELLPAKKQRLLREREHDFILPKIKTERFKRSFLNRCIFDYFSYKDYFNKKLGNL